MKGVREVIKLFNRAIMAFECKSMKKRVLNKKVENSYILICWLTFIFGQLILLQYLSLFIWIFVFLLLVNLVFLIHFQFLICLNNLIYININWI